MLGTLVMLAFAAAGCAVAGILFVLFGPVPVKRRVNMVSRISAPMPIASAPVAFEAPVLGVPAIAQPISQPIAALGTPGPIAVTAVPQPVELSESQKYVAPLVVRKPRGEQPAPLARTRSARGTELPRRAAPPPPPPARAARPAPVQYEEEHTEQFDVEEMTHVEDGRRYH